MNKVVLIGRLTKEPELRYTPDGTAVASFTLAVNRPFTNAQGNREADFIPCVVWRKPAENTANYLTKGSKAGVSGRWQTRNFEGQDGKRVYVNELVADEVEFLDSPGGGQNNGQGAPGGSTNTNTTGGNQNRSSGQNGGNGGGYNRNDDPFASDGKPIDISDDDLPF